MYDEEARAADIVITTALIPGRPAPRLITEETVAGMRPGSVIVDMAAANGGNVAMTVADEQVVTDTAYGSSATPTWRAACRRRPPSSTAPTSSTC